MQGYAYHVAATESDYYPASFADLPDAKLFAKVKSEKHWDSFDVLRNDSTIVAKFSGGKEISTL